MQHSLFSAFISKPTQGTRWVIPDIHGCAKTFKTLVKKIQLQTNDHLYLLGDYLDRGPDSGGVLDFIFYLQNADYQVFPLRGNHEQLLIESYRDYEPKLFERYLKFEKCFNMTNEAGEVKPEYLDFLNQLPYYYELEDCYLVHAGFDFSKPNPLENLSGMIWVREFEPPLGFKRIIRGHKVCDLSDIQVDIQIRNQVISMDNGCVYRPKAEKRGLFPQMGNLLALNLDTWQLIIQENVDFL